MRTSPFFPILLLLWIWPAISFLTFLGHLVLLLRNWVQSPARGQGRESVFDVLFCFTTMCLVMGAPGCFQFLLDFMNLKSFGVFTNSETISSHSHIFIFYNPSFSLLFPWVTLGASWSISSVLFPLFFILMCLRSCLTSWATLNHGLSYWALTSLTGCFHCS